jgi:phosphoglucomutase
MDKEHFLRIIESWQFIWMNQTQNSEADRKNYFGRALGVDANMRHSLAALLATDSQRTLARHQKALAFAKSAILSGEYDGVVEEIERMCAEEPA